MLHPKLKIVRLGTGNPCCSHMAEGESGTDRARPFNNLSQEPAAFTGQPEVARLLLRSEETLR